MDIRDLFEMDVKDVMKKSFKSIWSKVMIHLNKHEEQNKAYIIGGYIFTVITLIYFIGFFIFPELIIVNSGYYFIDKLMYPLICVFSIAIIVEYYKLFKKLVNNKWLFWAINLFIGIISNALAQIYTGKMINHIVGLDPSFFPEASSVLMIISTIVILLFLGIIIMSIYIFFYMFYILISKKISWIKRIGKPLGMIGVVIFLSYMLNFLHSPYIQKLEKIIIVTSEYYDKSYCNNKLEKKVLYADIGRGLISMYNPKTEEFYPIEKCKRNK